MFRPSEGHSQVRINNLQVISINMIATVKNSLRNTTIIINQLNIT